ncbi:hypothetical protein [Streptomyces sp. cg35]|uniref:hypothetical protein n=1 Tax=Streptomyces sp. cg35 TaxID=3421650 RepID=UPI003D17A110
MTDPSAYDFPADLLAAQKQAATLYDELHAFPKRPGLSWSVEPLDGWQAEDAPHGGKVSRFRSTRPDSPGWSDEDKAAYAALRQELTAQAHLVLTHTHWKTYEGSDLVKARMQLTSPVVSHQGQAFRRGPAPSPHTDNGEPLLPRRSCTELCAAHFSRPRSATEARNSWLCTAGVPRRGAGREDPRGLRRATR